MEKYVKTFGEFINENQVNELFGFGKKSPIESDLKTVEDFCNFSHKWLMNLDNVSITNRKIIQSNLDKYQDVIYKFTDQLESFTDKDLIQNSNTFINIITKYIHLVQRTYLSEGALITTGAYNAIKRSSSSNDDDKPYNSNGYHRDSGSDSGTSDAPHTMSDGKKTKDVLRDCNMAYNALVNIASKIAKDNNIKIQIRTL